MFRLTRLLIAVALVAYIVVLVVVLLNPSPAAPSALIARTSEFGLRSDLPSVLFTIERVEFGLNVLALAPVAFLGSLLRPSLSISAWTTAGFAGSILVEAAQVFLADRSPTHSDVVANTLGAALGAIVAWVINAVAARRQ